MSLEGPVPTRLDVITIVRDLYTQHEAPVTTTQVMEEARRRGFRGWYSAYKRRLELLVDTRQLRIDRTRRVYSYLPAGDPDGKR